MLSRSIQKVKLSDTFYDQNWVSYQTEIPKKTPPTYYPKIKDKNT